MVFAENHGAFYGPDDPGVFEVRVDGVKIYGGFDDEYYGEDMASSRPVFQCESAQLPSLTQGTSTVTRVIDGVVYTIVGIEPDGYGQTVLKLHKQ